MVGGLAAASASVIGGLPLPTTRGHESPLISPRVLRPFSEVSAFIRLMIKELHILRAEQEQEKGEFIPTTFIFQKKELASPAFHSPFPHRFFIITSVVLLCNPKHDVCSLFKEAVTCWETRTIVSPEAFLFSHSGLDTWPSFLLLAA